jgi:signal transduction histidine kinase
MIISSLGFLPAYGIDLPPFSYFATVFFVLILTLAITRYHLFGIEVILTEILVGAIGLLLVIQIFSAPTILWRIINGTIFALFCIFGYLLIKSVFETERLAARERALREEAERLSAAKDQFILSIQHHLRTPLTPVMGYLSMILEGVFGEEKNPKIKEKLIAMQKSVKVLHKLMEDLLDISQLRVGKKILNLEKVNLEEIIEDVIEELKPQAKEKGLYIKFKKENLPKMKLDRMRIREAIFNLLDNAIKYTQKGGVEINCKLQNSKCKIEIKDTGIGMTKEEMESFLKGTLFERGKEAKKAWGPGRGIGLAIAVEFVKAHGGRVLAQSEGRNKGTTFIVELPLK